MGVKKKNDWFDNVFLASQIERLQRQPEKKYGNRVILSEKQAYVFERYAELNQHYDCSYGTVWSTMEYENDQAKFSLSKAGRYNFLYISRK